MKHRQKMRRYKGYGSPPWFSESATQLRYSNRRLFFTLTLVAAAVALMVWGLTQAKGAF